MELDDIVGEIPDSIIDGISYVPTKVLIAILLIVAIALIYILLIR